MRGWLPLTLRRIDANSRDVLLLALVLVHLAFFGLARELGEVTPLQAGVAASAYVLMALYLLVAARNGGRRSVPDLVAGTSVFRTA